MLRASGAQGVAGDGQQSPWKVRAALIAICVAGLGLRMWGIGWGLPQLYHQDEPATMKAALSFGQGLGAVAYPQHPHLFHEILFGLYGLGYLAERLLGRVDSTSAYLGQFVLDPSAWVMTGRILAALFGVATIPLMYWLSRLAYDDRKIGLLSALAPAVAFFHVRGSHYCRQDIPALCFGMLASGCALLVIRRGARLDYARAGISTGLAVATNWNMLLWVVGLCLAHMLGNRHHRRPWVFCLGSLLLAGVTFVVASPAIALRFTEVCALIGRLTAATGTQLRDASTSLGVLGWWQYVSCYLPAGIGWVGLVTGLGGIAYALRRRSACDLWWVLMGAGYFTFIGSYTRSVRPDYILPLVPFLLLLGVRWLTVLSRPLQWGVLAALLATNIAASLRHDWLITQPDTRTLAKEWIERTIPSRAVLAVDHGRTLQAWLPQLHESVPQAVGSVEGDMRLGTGQWRLMWLQQAQGRQQYHLIELVELPHTAPQYENYYDLKQLRGQGVDYVILSSFVTQFHQAQQPMARKQFYRELARRADRVAVFPPSLEAARSVQQDYPVHTPLVGLWRLTRPGPTIEVYRLRQAP